MMNKEKLLEILKQIENEIDELSEHGDIPNDSYFDLTNLVNEARDIINE